MRAHESQDPYQSRVFARLPTYQQVLSLVEPTVESLQQHGVVITTQYFVSLLDEQYSACPDSYADNPARWAIVNSFFATAMLNRSTTDFLKEVTPVARNYFKNAFSMLPELITQGREVSACEALLSMAMFTQCTGDAHLTMQITAAATRLVQTLGLHRSRFYLSLDPIAARRYRRVFWVAYILDVDAMAKYDISPSLGDDHIPLTLQHDSSPRNTAEPCDFASPTLLQWRSELAVIQRRIQTQLHPGKGHHLTDDELLKTVRSMGGQLQEWESSLPEQVWAKEYPDDGPDLTMTLAFLHCAFLNSLTSVHMALASLRFAERPGPDSSLPPRDSHLQAEIQKAWAKCLGSARDMIEVAVSLPPQPFFQLWYVTSPLSPQMSPDYQLTHICQRGIMCYPLSAVFILLSAILEEPSSATAQDDLRRIGQFVTFVKRAAGDGCDVQRLLNACTKLRDVASCAVNTSQLEEQSQSSGMASALNDASAQLKVSNTYLVAVCPSMG